MPPDFARYREASRAIRTILLQLTDRIEPLSLDEAYLEVTEPKSDLVSATEIARSIRAEIQRRLQLTASEGVAPNKFLAKIASDGRKPDGLSVIWPAEVDAFVSALPVTRWPGVGRVTASRLVSMGVVKVGDLRQFGAPALEEEFGRFGLRLHELARGIDPGRVVPDRPVQSISAEDTFAEDRLLQEVPPTIQCRTAKTWSSALKTPRQARTVVLKLKTSDFRILTRSLTRSGRRDR